MLEYLQVLDWILLPVPSNTPLQLIFKNFIMQMYYYKYILITNVIIN